MEKASSTIRELRTDFRSVKRKLEAHGEIVITDHGKPSYLLKALEEDVEPSGAMPDYAARLKARQPYALDVQATQDFWDEDRGEG